MLTVAIANFHSPTAPLPLGSQFEVEGYKFGHLKGVLQARTFAPPSLDVETLSGSVRRTGKEDGREYELKPSIVVQRVQLPPGKGQSASRKPALRVTAMVARSVGEQVLKLRESASKSVNAEALVVRIAGAASTWPL